MSEATCIHCGREIVFVKRQDTGDKFALEKIYPYKIDITMLGSTAVRVDPLEGNEHLDLYSAHSRICSKKETT